MAKITPKEPYKTLSGKPFKSAPFAFCTNRVTGAIHTQWIYPWTHEFNEKQLAAQEKMRETNRRVHEILSDSELRRPFEEEWERSAPKEERRRLRDYVFMKVYRGK